MPAPATRTLRDALAEYFAANGLPAAGGYDARWVVVRLGGVPVFAFPNTPGRRRIVEAHDLHHVLTGYRTDIRGEGEIAAWEIAAGCRDRSALRLELRVLGFALPRWPRAMFAAFRRGLPCTNLLDSPRDAGFLERGVGEVRRESGLERPLSAADAAERRAFARWAALALAIVWGPLVPIGLGL